MNSGAGNLWYAIQTRPRFESVAARHLEGKGYEHYLPTYRCRRRWSDRVKEIELPLFPGYLFCKLDVQKRLPVLIVPGVVSIVGTGKNPQPVSEGEVLSIQRIASSGLQYEPWPLVNIGQWVTVEYGPLRGLKGRVVDTKKNYKIIVSVELLQRSVSVEIDRDCIRPISAPAKVVHTIRPEAMLVG